MVRFPRKRVCRQYEARPKARCSSSPTAADRHRVGHRFEPALHGIECRFVLPASNALLFAGRAQGAGWADATGLLVAIDVDQLAGLNGGMALVELLADRAAIGIGVRLIDERRLAPQAAGLGGRGVRPWHHRCNTDRGTTTDLLTLIVTTVGKGDEFGTASLSFCGLCHLQQV